MIAKPSLFCLFIQWSWLGRKIFRLFSGLVILPGFLHCKTDFKVSVVAFSNANDQEISVASDQAALLQGLRDSKVLRVCAGFLDGKSIAGAITRLLLPSS